MLFLPPWPLGVPGSARGGQAWAGSRPDGSRVLTGLGQVLTMQGWGPEGGRGQCTYSLN